MGTRKGQNNNYIIIVQYCNYYGISLSAQPKQQQQQQQQLSAV